MTYFALQRSYKYIMYATKQPCLKINQADLMCKNGCEFYGNADWHGYCSKCYRLFERQKRASHSQTSSSVDTQVPGFSKFEEKKRHQSDRKKYLKSIGVFRKTSNSKDCERGDRTVIETRPKISGPDLSRLDSEYNEKCGVWGDLVKHDLFKCCQHLITKLHDEFEACRPIEEVADIVQKYYKLYQHRTNMSQIYQSVSPEGREDLVGYFEQYVTIGMFTKVFCPACTTDEEKDLAIQERIRRLRWVNAHHLDCCIRESSVEVRELVYTAITDLLQMDSVKAPQAKLSCVVHCCRSVVAVLQHCKGGPVSADEFLPALIFVVLKANPARLKSNILYVTRFCYDTKLMQGEVGYYFTNLCCAVSFIENLTADSLNMPQVEFDAHMNGDITTVSAWESALVACEGMHHLCEHLSLLQGLSKRTTVVNQEIDTLEEKVLKFKDEIFEKVDHTLDTYPLTIKTRPPLNLLISRNQFTKTYRDPEQPPQICVEQSSIVDNDNNSTASNHNNYYQQNLQLCQQSIQAETSKSKLHLQITPCVPPSTTNEEKLVEALDYLTLDSSNPIEHRQHQQYSASNDSHDDYDNDNDDDDDVSRGNFDVEFSDISAENSICELTPERRHALGTSPTAMFIPDPFSPILDGGGIYTETAQQQIPLIPACVPLINPTSDGTESKLQLQKMPTENCPNDDLDTVGTPILDKSDGSQVSSDLPSPLKPIRVSARQTYTGFSQQESRIPSIPCITGDLHENYEERTGPSHR